MVNKIQLGVALILVLLSASIYVVSQDNNVRIDIKNTYSEFKVFENDSWIISGQERTVLMDGTAKMRASNRVVNSTIEGNTTTIYRYSYFKNGIIAVDTYVFDGNEKDVELFPVSHEINILGADRSDRPYILVYEVSKLGYYGETDYEIGSAHEFEHNMKVEWDDGNYYERLFKYKNEDKGKLEIKYRIDSNNFTKNVRLYDPIINTDSVFTELIYNYADIDKGVAIYEINNPVDNLSVEDLYHSYNLFEGEGLSKIESFIEVVSEIDVPKYKIIETNYSCEKFDNETGINYTDICVHIDNVESGFNKEIITSWEPIENLSKGKHKIKVVGYWEELGGVQSLDWFPHLDLDKDKYDLPKDKFGKVESKLLKQIKWAWWNTSWDYYKEYSNLTGNITYMFFNASINDNADFNDTRFISCDNTTLLNHTLEAKFGTFGQFRVNNLGQNCAFRYYGNTVASITSSASAVYLNPISAYYFDSNANDFVGNNDGNVIGATLTTGYINGSYNFDGNDYIDFGSLDAMSQSAYTVSVWIKTSTNGAIMSEGVASAASPFYSLHIVSGKVRMFQRETGGLRLDVPSTTTVTDGAWHMVTFTQDSGNYALYVDDGIAEASGSYTNPTQSTTKSVAGAQYSNGALGYYHNGLIEELYIYEKSLSESEINKLFTQKESIVIEGEEHSRIIPDFFPSVTLNLPENDSIQTNQYVIFNTTVTDDIKVQNVSLYIDGLINQTNSSNYNGTYIFNVSVPESNHNWSILAYDNASQSNQSETRIFISDFFNPAISIDFPLDSEVYNFNITTLNTTASDTHLEACWYSLDNFTTNTTFTCNTDITGLLSNEGVNYWRACANDSVSNENCTLSTFEVDLTDPIVSIVYPESINYEINITELNYTILHPIGTLDKCWYSFDNGTTNSSTVASGTNFTGISSSQGTNYWTVYCNDTASRLGSDLVTFNVVSISLLINGTASNQTSELGTEINVSATLDVLEIFIDVTHPDYGINYSSGFSSTSFSLIIDYFRKAIFNDSTTSKVISYSGEENQTIYFPAHQWDEVDNFSINMSGLNFTQYPENVLFYKSNTSEVDRIFPGFMVNSIVYLNKQIDSELNQSLFFQNPGSSLVSFLMDDNAEFISFIFNVSGIEFGVEYEDDFNDENILDVLANEGMFRGGFALPEGNNLKSFVYDIFNTSSTLDSLLWSFIGNGVYYVCGTNIFSTPCSGTEQYIFTIDNNYASSNLYMSGFFEEDYQGTTSGSETVNNFAYVNYTKFNIWTNQKINIELEYDITGVEQNSKNGCTAYNEGYIGEVLFWQSPWQQCDDAGVSNCNEGSRDLGGLIFELDRNINNSWSLLIGGTAEAYGDDLDAGDCGSYSFVYNYTNNSLSKTYQFPGGSCAFVDSVEDLDNEYLIEDLEFNTVEQFKFNQYNRGTFDGDPAEGCDSITATTNVELLNYSIYNLTNSSIVSSTVFNSAGDLSRATMNISLWDLNSVTDAFYLFLSADGGINWESVANGVEHIFSNQGTDLRYKINFTLGEEGYSNNTIFSENLTITTPKGYPTNLSFDFGNDGIEDFAFTGELNETNSPITINVSSANLILALNKSPILYDHLVSVPLKVTSATVGELNLTNFNITYNPNPIKLNVTSIWNYLLASLGFVDFPIQIESIGGNITLDDIRYDYAGGNSTIEILAHNDDYSINDSLNLIYYYSKWDYEWVPYGVEWIYFAPKNSSDKNVRPYGQTNTIPILNLTNYGYGGLNATLSIYQDGASSCVNTTMSLDNNKSNGVLLSESWTNLTSMEYLQTEDIYLFADYNCSDNTWVMFEPQYYFRQCVEGGLCDTQLI